LKTLLTHQDINIRKSHLFRTSSLLKSSVLLHANLQLKISKTGRYQHVFRIGKMLMGIQFLFIKDSRLTVETYKTLKSIVDLLPLPMLCTPLSVRQGKRQTNVTRSNMLSKCLSNSKENRRSNKRLTLSEKRKTR
jgi:hypothetical protein